MSKRKAKPKVGTLSVLEAETPNPPVKRQFNQKEIREYDFAGWNWEDLPKEVVKCAPQGAFRTKGAKVTAAIECVECKRRTWTTNPKVADMCEECEYLIRAKNWDTKIARDKRNGGKLINPFVEHGDETPNVNPFRSLED